MNGTDVQVEFKNANEETERCVLASMLLSREYIPNITAVVSEGDFFFPKYRDIFRAIMRMYETQKELNLVTLNMETEGRYPVDVATLSDVVPSGANWEFYTGQVKRLAQVREFRELLDEGSDVNTENIDSVLAKFSARSAEIGEASGGQIKTARDFILPMITQIENAMHRKTEYSGYDIGIDSVNRLVDGLQKEYIVLGARASIGKTAGAINIARALVRNRIPTGIFSLEMSGKSLLMRMMSDVCNVQATMLKNGMIRPESFKRINDAGIEMADWPLYIIDDTRGQFERIVAKTRYMVRCLGVKVIMIDHASLMRYQDRRLPRHEQHAEMSNAIQNLQRELDIPIIVLAQLVRDAEGKKPTLADLRESGAYEQDADQVWMLHRDRAIDANDTCIPTDWIVPKNRNGACGQVEVYFQPQFVRFVDKAKEE